MDNNDRLIRLRYALDIKDQDMVKIFKLGGMVLTLEDVRKLLIKNKDAYNDEVDDLDLINEKEENIRCTYRTLESFLNGFITYKRGPSKPQPGQAPRPAFTINDSGSVNNVLLKKMKIALSLTSEDVLAIMERAGVTVTKGELGALLRKEGHKNYKVCGDKYARHFLKGLAMTYRK